ncbi:MAG: helix-turn-helix transcriptional regulator [Alphaproteobacteria bacterium]|nr:helix-turn-helix transcriptional regulator [Alphaproteobacteria bacterium]
MKKTYKNSLKKLREQSGLTLQQAEDKMKELAEMHGLQKQAVSYVQIARHENGASPPNTEQLELYLLMYHPHAKTIGDLLLGPEENAEILNDLRTIMSGLSDTQQKAYVDMIKAFTKQGD